jgi:hypothetical protein
MRQSESNLARDRFRTARGEIVPLCRDRHGPTFERWLGKGGHLVLRWKNAGVVQVIVRGHGDGRFANPILRAFDTMADRYGTITVFCDFGQMPTYDSALRKELTDWCRERRRSLRAFHVVAESKIVVMGFSIANLALGGIIESHIERDTFEAAMRRAG